MEIIKKIKRIIRSRQKTEHCPKCGHKLQIDCKSRFIVNSYPFSGGADFKKIIKKCPNCGWREEKLG